MSTPGPLEIAARWREAVSANDMPALGALYEPSARIWVNLADRAYQLEEHLARIASARAACSSWEYEHVRCTVFDRGYVSRHRVRVVVGGKPTLTVAAVFVELTDGRIHDMQEYLAPPRVAP